MGAMLLGCGHRQDRHRPLAKPDEIGRRHFRPELQHCPRPSIGLAATPGDERLGFHQLGDPALRGEGCQRGAQLGRQVVGLAGKLGARHARGGKRPVDQRLDGRLMALDDGDPFQPIEG